MALRPATQKDIEYLATRLRPEDVREIELGSGVTPYESLSYGAQRSVPHAWVLCAENDLPYAIGGVTAPPVGVVWLLATPDVTKHALTFQRTIKAKLQEIWRGGEYYILHNAVHAANETAVDWLFSLGAIVWWQHIIEPQKELFFFFQITAPPAEQIMEAYHV